MEILNSQYNYRFEMSKCHCVSVWTSRLFATITSMQWSPHVCLSKLAPWATLRTDRTLSLEHTALIIRRVDIPRYTPRNRLQ